jgi:hypothetical protein
MMPANATFKAAYFIDYILELVAQLDVGVSARARQRARQRASASVAGDNARRKLRLHFDNSACHISHAVIDTMT